MHGQLPDGTIRPTQQIYVYYNDNTTSEVLPARRPTGQTSPPAGRTRSNQFPYFAACATSGPHCSAADLDRVYNTGTLPRQLPVHRHLRSRCLEANSYQHLHRRHFGTHARPVQRRRLPEVERAADLHRRHRRWLPGDLGRMITSSRRSPASSDSRSDRSSTSSSTGCRSASRSSYPASACPNCGSGIHGYDNVPLVSWLALRGKCRSCSEPISARYPLVELGTGLFFFVVSLPLAAQLAAVQPTVNDDRIRAHAGRVPLPCGDLDRARRSSTSSTTGCPTRSCFRPTRSAASCWRSAGILTGDYAALLRAGIGMAAMAARLLPARRGVAGRNGARRRQARRRSRASTSATAAGVRSPSGALGAFFLGGDLRPRAHPAPQEHEKIRDSVRAVDGPRCVGRNLVRQPDLERLLVALRSGRP